jgi:hypothetical protein
MFQFYYIDMKNVSLLKKEKLDWIVEYVKNNRTPLDVLNGKL